MSTIVIGLTLFVFALIIGIAIIGRVPTTLHTPLMSGANSIHGVVLIGVIIVAGHINSPSGAIIIFLASLFGTLNVVGGYVVTDRMLEMFKAKKSGNELEDLVEVEVITQQVENKRR
jgi:NAD(P) transhydrogenase subunit alpha